MSSPLLASMAPSRTRRALVVPLIGEDFEPGAETYEWLLSDLRSDVDLFLLTLPFGVISERTFLAHPELVDDPEESRRSAMTEGLVQTRTWLAGAAGEYRRIGVVKRGPLMKLWSRAVSGSRAASSVRVVPVNSRLGWRDSLLKRRIRRALT